MNKHITLKWLEQQNACGEGKNWFALRYPNGVGHRELYTALQSEHKDWGYWLLAHIGGTEFAIRCALRVYKEPSWVEWANKWLSGEDRTAATAAAAEHAAGWAAADNLVASYAAAAAARTASHTAYTAAAAAARFAAVVDPTIDLLAILDECEERGKVNE